MTQYTDAVLEREKELEIEKLDQEVSYIEFKFKDSKCYITTTGFKSGRVLTEFSDKRKKDIIDYS